ncbi:MAG: hypothetical protein NVSMB22_28740 [Chloroflexota bacterium]
MAGHKHEELSRTLYDAFNRLDFDTVLAYVADDCEVENVAWGQSFRGKAGFREFMQVWKTAYPDGTVEVVSQVAGDDGVTSENVFRGTHTGTLASPFGEVPATGRPFQNRFCEVWRMRDGKIISLHNYSDNMSAMQQLGLVPEAQAVTA